MNFQKLVLIILPIFLYCSCNQGNNYDDIKKRFEVDMRNFMLDFIEEAKVPGIGFAFYSDRVGTIFLAEGTADIENNIPLEISTLYPIQSVTKMFLSILTIQLIEEGELSLESTIDQWVDGVPYNNHITIKHLLQQTSGLNSYQANTDFTDEYYFSNNEKIYNRNDLINAGLAIPYNIEEFGSFKYSNTNFLILANIIEIITNQTIGQELEKRIFRPAEMNDTYFKPEFTNDKHDIVKCYEYGKPLDLEKINFISNAAGGIISTLGDMMKFADWILDNKYHIPMSSELFGDMSFDGGKTIIKYGLGLVVTTTKVYNTMLMGHTGGNGGLTHEFYFSTETGEIIIFYYNGQVQGADFHYKEKLDTLFRKYRKIEY